ncbi:MAG: hypothetical protein HN348_25035 [Proteobacteria bacterium]|nr:hypothetical protein [Pseudomonadota bacterium]
MSAIGLRVGPFEIQEQARVPEPGEWYLARRTGMTRRQPAEVLVKLLPQDASPEERVTLQKEFENLRSVEDPKIPGAVAYYEGTGAMAISRVEGTPLAEVLASRQDDVTSRLTPGPPGSVGRDSSTGNLCFESASVALRPRIEPHRVAVKPPDGDVLGSFGHWQHNIELVVATEVGEGALDLLGNAWRALISTLPVYSLRWRRQSYTSCFVHR